MNMMKDRQRRKRWKTNMILRKNDDFNSIWTFPFTMFFTLNVFKVSTFLKVCYHAYSDYWQETKMTRKTEEDYENEYLLIFIVYEQNE